MINAHTIFTATCDYCGKTIQDKFGECDDIFKLKYFLEIDEWRVDEITCKCKECQDNNVTTLNIIPQE